MTDTAETMVERVATALRASYEENPYAWDMDVKPERRFANIARAAIAAMAEPTQDMENAADDLDASGAPYCPGSPAEVYRTMIQAALAEKPE